MLTIKLLKTNLSHKKMEGLKKKQIRTFSATFKKEKVKEIEAKQITVAQLCRLYKVSTTAVYKWINRYGSTGKGERVVIEKESEAQKTEKLLKKVADLEQLLGKKQVEIEYLKKVIEIGSEEVNVDIKKKFGSKR
jgi:transposase